MKQRTIGVIVLTIVMLAALSIPQGFAKGGPPNGVPNGKTSNYQRTNLLGVSYAAAASPASSPASCGDLGFKGKFGTVWASHGTLAVRLQGASPNNQYSVWLGYKTSSGGCDGSWQQLGWMNTNADGNGGFARLLGLSSDRQYQVVVRDTAGNTIYATAFFSP